MSIERNAASALLALVLAVPATAGAATPERRRHHDRDRCREDCRRSDDHGGDGDREKCVGLIAMCDAVIIPPTPFTPAPEGQALTSPQALFPPSPEKLVQAIQAGAAGIGKAAGDLAGAAAALPIAILL